MAREELPDWRLLTAAACTGLCLLLAWGPLQAQPSEPGPTAAGGIPDGYRISGRGEIMLGAVGPVFN